MYRKLILCKVFYCSLICLLFIGCDCKKEKKILITLNKDVVEIQTQPSNKIEKIFKDDYILINNTIIDSNLVIVKIDSFESILRLYARFKGNSYADHYTLRKNDILNKKRVEKCFDMY